MDAEFRQKGWAGYPAGRGPAHGEVRGRALGVVGYGPIGHEVATRARAFGMHCVGIRRSNVPSPYELEWLGGPECLPELLAASDFVLVAYDMNDEKVGLIGAEQLAQMKLGGVIINVARGRIIDEYALYEALAFKRIGGAIFYTWYSYYAAGEEAVWTCQ